MEEFPDFRKAVLSVCPLFKVKNYIQQGNALFQFVCRRDLFITYLYTGVREISYHPNGLTTWPLPAAFIWGVSNENVTEIYLVKNFT
jgi:hypothetical protein